MKLEHLMQAYKVNNVEAELKEMNEEDGRAGVINFSKGIAASYLLDEEEIVVCMKIFINCLSEKLEINNQLSHTISVMNVIQNTIMLLSNIPQKECNMILDALGLFNNTFKEGKQIIYLEHSYEVKIVDGLLLFSICEIGIDYAISDEN